MPLPTGQEVRTVVIGLGDEKQALERIEAERIQEEVSELVLLNPFAIQRGGAVTYHTTVVDYTHILSLIEKDNPEWSITITQNDISGTTFEFRLKDV